MDSHDRAIDHLHLAIVSLHDGTHQSVPDASFPPAIKAIIGRCVWPVALGQIAPRRADAQNIEHRIDDPAIVLRLRPTPIHWQKRFDDTPLKFREIVTSHDPCSTVHEREPLLVSQV